MLFYELVKQPAGKQQHSFHQAETLLSDGGSINRHTIYTTISDREGPPPGGFIANDTKCCMNYNCNVPPPTPNFVRMLHLCCPLVREREVMNQL